MNENEETVQVFYVELDGELDENNPEEVLNAVLDKLQEMLDKGELRLMFADDEVVVEVPEEIHRLALAKSRKQ